MPHLQPERVTRAVRQYMVTNLVVFEYEVVPPSVFEVHLSTSDHERLQPLFRRAEADIMRGLDAALREWEENTHRDSGFGKVIAAVRNPVNALRKQKRKEITYPRNWKITFLEDPELPAGDFEVAGIVEDDGAKPHLEGKKTLCVKTRYSTRQTADPNAADSEPGDSNGEPRTSSRRPLARISFMDAHGARVYEMRKEEIKIGRAAPGYWADIAIETDPGVSREHLRVRFDASRNQFFAVPLGGHETTVDGKPVHGEHLLPQKAVIGLAGKITLEFEALSETP